MVVYFYNKNHEEIGYYGNVDKVLVSKDEVAIWNRLMMSEEELKDEKNVEAQVILPIVDGEYVQILEG